MDGLKLRSRKTNEGPFIRKPGKRGHRMLSAAHNAEIIHGKQNGNAIGDTLIQKMVVALPTTLLRGGSKGHLALTGERIGSMLEKNTHRQFGPGAGRFSYWRCGWLVCRCAACMSTTGW